MVSITRQEKINDYNGFVEKFKPKKTTDDCITPPKVYEVVKNYVCSRWSVNPGKVVRPFWPGGNYEAFDYPSGTVVIDNPPFSILTKIVRFYLAERVPFFLFCPSLTALSGGVDVNHIICDCSIVYENGAVVRTSFVTSFGRPNVVESCPELTRQINEALHEILKTKKLAAPKYVYPDELVTAAMIQRYAKYGIRFEIKSDECVFVRALDGQRAAGKTVYGGGLLLSGQKAAERAAAERVAEERAVAERADIERTATHVWRLSDRERGIVDMLSSGGSC